MPRLATLKCIAVIKPIVQTKKYFVIIGRNIFMVQSKRSKIYLLVSYQMILIRYRFRGSQVIMITNSKLTGEACSITKISVVRSRFDCKVFFGKIYKGTLVILALF